VPPPIELVNWDEIDGNGKKAKDAEKNGNGTLFN